jgi:hypothetical protein
MPLGRSRNALPSSRRRSLLVRFTPESGQGSTDGHVRLGQKRTYAPQQKQLLFDHLVVTAEQRGASLNAILP